MKKKVKTGLFHFIKYDGITAVIAATIILVVIFIRLLKNEKIIEIMDWTILTSIIVAMLMKQLSDMIRKRLMNKLEDSVKLTTNYDLLASKYTTKLITYDNSGASEINLHEMRKLRKDQELTVCIPAICDYRLERCEIAIMDSRSEYELPALVQEHFDELFAAHETSQIYNQLNIRVDSWSMEGNVLRLRTSRTTFFDSLVTNRAMDFRWKNGLTIRDRFQYGPFFPALEESCLSNHLGFNGFIESSDGFIVFVKRKKQLSIGKGTYGNSIGACLKTKYALDCAGNFTEAGLRDGILQNIENELKIPKEYLEDFSFKKHIIAAYRDMVEGGKPQLLFFIRSSWDKDTIMQNFTDILRTASRRETEEASEDGVKLLWILKTELKEMCILPDRMIQRGKSYSMMPSASASIVMLLRHLSEQE